MHSSFHRFLTLAVSVALFAASCSDSPDLSSPEASSSTSTSSDDGGTSSTSSQAESTIETAPTTAVVPSVATLDWSPCDGLECATLRVPLDYNAPTGEHIDIAVARVATAGPNRIGSIVLNPGGPGGSGITFLETAALAFPQEVAQRFDLVSFDPRGVGQSTAIDCSLDFDDAIAVLAADDQDGWDAALQDEIDQYDACPAEAFALAPYVGTNNAARDMDRLRAALGDDQLTFLGYSYGTRLGATYAELFPENVRALVLDAAVLPSDDSGQLNRDQAAGFDAAFENFAAACDADADCLLQELGPTIEVFRNIEREITSTGTFDTSDPDRVLTVGEFYLGIIAALYSVDAWPLLDQALYIADTQADGSILQILGDNLVDRRPDGTYTNSNEANKFINCADDPLRPSAEDTRELLASIASETEYFAPLFRPGSACLLAPEALDPLALGPATGAAPIVVIGNTGDPATPFEWSEALAASLDSAVLYTVEAEGHTAYMTFGCLEADINAYLIDLVVPAAGATCSENATSDFFPTAGEGQTDQLIAFFDCIRDEGLPVGEVTIVDILADPTGETLFDGIDLNAPATQAAFLACQSLLPDS